MPKSQPCLAGPNLRLQPPASAVPPSPSSPRTCSDLLSPPFLLPRALHVSSCHPAPHTHGQLILVLWGSSQILILREPSETPQWGLKLSFSQLVSQQPCAHLTPLKLEWAFVINCLIILSRLALWVELCLHKDIFKSQPPGPVGVTPALEIGSLQMSVSEDEVIRAGTGPMACVLIRR